MECFVDEKPRSKLLKKASSEDISSRPETNLRQYHRSKSDLPTGERTQRAQLVHQSSGELNVWTMS